jgi:hypothetical protein
MTSLAEILDEACMLIEQRGISLSREIEEDLAKRISRSALRGESDHANFLLLRSKVLTQTRDG